MALLCPLGSGSSGNCTLVRGGTTTLLVDAGTSCKAICTALEQCQVSYEEVDGILLTHEHTDHIKALPVLLKKINVPVYATHAVLDYITKNLKIPANIPLVPVEDKPFCLHDVEITAFPTPHDSVGSVGYQIHTPDDRRVGVATDLGHMTPEIMENLKKCNGLLLESNYDDGMILCSPYPYYLKRRIMSPSGHLSNDDCAQAAAELARAGVSHLILGHLSQNNNLPDLAFSATRTILDQNGFEDVQLQVALRNQCSKPVIL